ncbi:MAG: ferritin [Desulfuromonas sp.]|uniref:ferritin-like domain-containing protein n=1 Tax=Desulfuromonas sp. TaxID=892 RepID=UPI000CB54A5F|nr:ferritin family protein [Desulfuromonas sp.]PLX84731.1 MAG: ferritin [Desulfuromonas sp.]
MNVFDFALQMETDGKVFYEKMARETKIPGLNTIFSRLADDEQKHYETIRALKDESPPSMAQTMVLEATQNVFTELLHEKDALGPIEGDLEGYRYAMKIEAESFRFYENAAKRDKDPAVAALLLRIADEERKHFNIVENILHFVDAPNNYLAWGEFSNIEEFRQFGRDVDL